MKKKFRNITVNGKKYGWTTRGNCDGDYNTALYIWFNKKIIYTEIVKGGIDVTPGFVKSIIENMGA